VPVPDNRNRLTGKVRLALQFVHDNTNVSFDWIMKADDDTFVIMENLKYLLSLVDPAIPVYTGFHLKVRSLNKYKRIYKYYDPTGRTQV